MSKTSAAHNVLIIDDNSSCKFKKRFNSYFEIYEGLRITKKEILYEKDYWKIISAHDGYFKKYNSYHERKIEFYPENNKLIGIDKIIGKKSLPNLKFIDIRFHLEPQTKVMRLKTINQFL